MPSVFISHNWNDKNFVRKLAKNLKKEGIEVWIDEVDMYIGDSIIQEIGNGIDKVDYFIAVISKNSVNSTWVQKELSIAMNKEIIGRKIFVLPIIIDDCDIPVFISDKLFTDFRKNENYNREFEKILRVIKKDLYLKEYLFIDKSKIHEIAAKIAQDNTQEKAIIDLKKALDLSSLYNKYWIYILAARINGKFGIEFIKEGLMKEKNEFVLQGVKDALKLINS